MHFPLSIIIISVFGNYSARERILNLEKIWQIHEKFRNSLVNFKLGKKPNKAKRNVSFLKYLYTCSLNIGEARITMVAKKNCQQQASNNIWNE